MAFHQQSRQAVQRNLQPPSEERDVLRAQEQDQEAPIDSQTWILFSPASEATTSASFTSNAPESVETAGRSRLSDLGSLDTIARSGGDSSSPQSVALSAAIDEQSYEDDAELDSLDSHLPEFRAIQNLYNQSPPAQLHSVPVLPTHDGLGSFRLDRQGVGLDIQEQLYAFERFNPRRLRRRRESVDLAYLGLENEQVQEVDKLLRIETWRLEHSRVLLEEVRRETKRRRKTESSRSRHQSADSAVESPGAQVNASGVMNQADGEEMDWHEEDASDGWGEGFWARMTRRVIQDLMGIDERLLAILFGEALPEEGDLSSTPKASDPSATMGPSEAGSSWQLQVLERVARELGLLVNHLSHHPGAFSTYVRMQQMPISYAGLPVIPESVADDPTLPVAGESSVSMPEFQPTIAQARPIPMSGVRQPDNQAETARQPSRSNTFSNPSSVFTQEEWEQDLDIKLVFRYLRSRFTSRSSATTPFTHGTPHLATSSTQDAAAKAARIRQHHPLASRLSRPLERRQSFKATAPATPVTLWHASSCASQSTRRSARRSSASSRRYWDIGGSKGTGSIIASTGPMGSWGEV